MPVGYGGEKMSYSRREQRWKKVQTEKAFDYDELTDEQKKSAALIISFFRYYPDYFYDMIRSPNAKYKIELPQRLFLRIWARYRNTYTTGSRGIAKSYSLQLGKDHDGLFFPGEKVRYVAPAQKQSAKIASDAFKTVCENYPLIGTWWHVNSDRGDMFRITTPYGSEFTMYAPRGDNCNAVVGEEIAAEGEDGFDIEAFESDISPTCRLTRKIHGIDDRAHINLKETYISNASSRQNKAFTVYRANALKDMLFGDKYDGFCMDISWKSALLCNIRDIAYYKKERKKLTQENWQREMEVRYTGTGENPMLLDEVLARAKRLQVAEMRHCGDNEAIYIVSHDVAYADGRKNAKCADTVIKLTRFKNENKRDKYRKQVVFVDNYPPLATHYDQAMRLKKLWLRFCKDGGGATYIVVDAQANGTVIAEELVKPPKDGTPLLKTINHLVGVVELEQKDALPVIYAVKSNATGGADREGDMIAYAQTEFEQGNVELLTTNILDGVDAYKNFHGIKDVSADGKIAYPYRQTELLCQQIANLRTKVSGASTKEERKSQSIQRDIWSSLKYGLHFASLLEKDLAKENNKAKSSWAGIIAEGIATRTGNGKANGDKRSELLALRHR